MQKNALLLKIKGILFDLDGTLLDTAPDMVYALNVHRARYGLPALPLQMVRPYAGNGVKALLQLGFDMDENDQRFTAFVHELHAIYLECIHDKTTFFKGMDEVLNFLDTNSIPWGIVTNRLERFAKPLFDYFHLSTRAACLVCGDTLEKRKPDPMPMLYAASMMELNAPDIVYVGDSDTDVLASQNAAMRSLVTLHGYRLPDADPYTWGATAYMQNASDIIDWVKGN